MSDFTIERDYQTNTGRNPSRALKRTPWVPLTIALIALAVIAATQMVMAFYNRKSLQAAYDGQKAQIEQSDRMQAQLTGLAGKTAQLANSGDPDAQSIVADFAKNNIKLEAPVMILQRDQNSLQPNQR
jgi:hypothetical protein